MAVQTCHCCLKMTISETIPLTVLKDNNVISFLSFLGQEDKDTNVMLVFESSNACLNYDSLRRQK